jgi:hypothetical protein
VSQPQLPPSYNYNLTLTPTTAPTDTPAPAPAPAPAPEINSTPEDSKQTKMKEAATYFGFVLGISAAGRLAVKELGLLNPNFYSLDFVLPGVYAAIIMSFIFTLWFGALALRSLTEALTFGMQNGWAKNAYIFFIFVVIVIPFGAMVLWFETYLFQVFFPESYQDYYKPI